MHSNWTESNKDHNSWISPLEFGLIYICVPHILQRNKQVIVLLLLPGEELPIKRNCSSRKLGNSPLTFEVSSTRRILFSSSSSSSTTTTLWKHLKSALIEQNFTYFHHYYCHPHLPAVKPSSAPGQPHHKHRTLHCTHFARTFHPFITAGLGLAGESTENPTSSTCGWFSPR